MIETNAPRQSPGSHCESSGSPSHEETSSIRTGARSRPSIFIAHPSAHLTDHIPNGDGLIAHGFISRLAARGYDLHIAADRVSLRQPFPANVTLYPLPMRSKNPAIRLLEYAIRMRLLFNRLCRRHHFGLALQMNPVFPGLSLALLGTGVPVILGTYVPRWDSGNAFKDGYTGSSGLTARLRDVIVALQQRCADALLLTTPAANNRVPQINSVSKKIFHLPHGIDPDLFAPPPVANHSRRKNILYLASVSERKGIFDLLQAFPKVVSRYPETRLTIVGPGDDLDRVKQAVAASAYRDQITLTGPVGREETANIYPKYTVYCLPSYGEPYATTLLEAMAVGLPIVTTTTGGSPYLVPPAGGRLVTPGDVAALAAALIEILGSEDLQRSMGMENRQAILEHFSWNRVIDRLEQIYLQVSHGRVGRELQLQ